MTERDLEAPEEDLVEQLTPATGDVAADSADAVEADPADRADQNRPVGLEDDGPLDTTDGSVEVDPADQAEQNRTVAVDDDEYR